MHSTTRPPSLRTPPASPASADSLASQTMQASQEPLVFMRFRPAWAYIDGVREFCRFFCETTYPDKDIAERARVVLQETLENAVKYSSPGQLAELELEVHADRDAFKIIITSRPDPRHLQNLKAELEHLMKLDPEAAYLAAFMRAASEPEASARLGLARMRYEARFELNLDEVADGRVSIVAVGKP